MQEWRPEHYSLYLGDCRRLPPAMGTIIKLRQTARTRIRRLEFYDYEETDLAAIRQQQVT